MANEIGGNNLFVSVLDDALVRAFRGFLDNILDFLIGGALLSANHEVDDGDIKSGNTECETAVKSQK